MSVKRIPCAEIEVGTSRRTVKPSHVDALVESIGAVGLMQPVAVRERAGGGYVLVSGAHRLAAVRQMGRDKIEAVILDLDDLLATIAECDENLCRAELTAMDRAQETARRKQAWLSLAANAEAAERSAKAKARGGKGGGEAARHGLLSNPLPTVTAFRAETAEATGKSAATVKRDERIGDGLSPRAADIIRAHPVADSPTQLDKLAALPAAQQVKAAKALAKDETLKLRDVMPKREPHADIPEDIRPVWGYLAAVAPQMLADLAGVKRRMKAMVEFIFQSQRDAGRDVCPGTPLFNCHNSLRTLDELESAVDGLVPSALCPTCEGSGKSAKGGGCAVCGKAGWMSARALKARDTATAKGKAALAGAGR